LEASGAHYSAGPSKRIGVFGQVEGGVPEATS
jgi:hypothetical protein